MRVDVAIVGAGPAGSVAAQRLAAAGAQVALLERTSFPRDKPCGDGVTGRGLAVLERLGLGAWTEQFHRPAIVRLVSPAGQALDRQANPGDDYCYGRIIPRRLLDERLAQAAVEAGARLVEETQVSAVERTDDNVQVLADGRQVTAQLAILTDGSHMPVTRQLGLARGPAELVALQQYLAGDGGPEERMEFHFAGPVLPFYNWLFPVGGGRVNVGTATYTQWAREGRINPQKVLTRFISDPATNGGRLARAEPVSSMRGHPMYTGVSNAPSHAERVLVAGDAAGLVGPLTGEGIAPALESGELAAAHALTALETGDFSAQALASYSRDLTSRYGADQRGARILRRVLSIPYLFNRIFHRSQRDRELALFIGYIFIGHTSPRLILRPATWLRLLLL
jgi:geranylgeranyl reductase family protein